jgi:hypothetical protein
MKRRLHQEDGVVLLLALGFIAFIGLVAVVLMNYATTNLRATVALRPVRSTEFAADGAVEGAINKLRQDPDACSGGKPNFYKVTPTINNQPIKLDCTEISASPRLVTFTAKCDTGGSSACPVGTTVLIARVRFDGVAPSVIPAVENWSVIQ